MDAFGMGHRNLRSVMDYQVKSELAFSGFHVQPSLIRRFALSEQLPLG